MDILSIIGVLLAGTAIAAGAVLKGAGLHALLSWAAFMIVMVGTLAAIFVQTPLAVMRRALVMLPWVFSPPARTPEAQIRKLVEWSGISRKQGLLGLEPVLGRETDPFLRRGLQLVVDGNSPDAVRATLEVDMQVRESADLRAARVFEGMGVYSPTLGIIGAVLGLMAVMQHLAEPSELGHGIAAAFTATVYGIGLANLLFLPMSNKLKVTVHAHAHEHSMLIEGLVGIAQGDNPRAIDNRLRSYLE